MTDWLRPVCSALYSQSPWLKDDLGGQALYLVTKPSPSGLLDKTHVDSFASVFTNGENALYSERRNRGGLRVIRQRFLREVNSGRLSGSVEEQRLLALCAPAADFGLLSADAKQRLDKPPVSMGRLEVARLAVSWLPGSPASRGRPSPCLGVACSFEFQITGAIDLDDLS